MNAEGKIRADRPADDIPEDVKRRRRAVVLIAGAVMLLAVVAGVFLGRARKAAPPAAPSSPAVTVVVPGRTRVAQLITATGTLSAKRDMPVGVAGEGGRVSRVLVDAGTWVRAGQTLATIDTSVQTTQTGQMGAQIAMAEADAKYTQSQLDRAQQLVGRGFISKADIDQRIATRDAAQAKVKLARAQYGEMSARLSRLDIRAPAAGLVLQRMVEPGQIVSSGTGALFRVAMGGEMELRARLAEQDLASIRVGMPATVTPIGSARSFVGHVWQVSPVIDPTSRQGEARVQLAYDPQLRPGGFANARFDGGDASAPVLPESAVLSDGKGGNFVYVVGPDDRVARRDVKIGEVGDAGIPILTGLAGDERVVYSAGAFLNPGDKVSPALRR